MRLRKRVVWRALLLAGLAAVAAGLILPLVNADRFGQRVKASLEQALGRQVEIGSVHLNLFRGPGFSVDRVVIYDDPAVSLEPFAYVESLEARVSFKSLWTGRLEFSSLRLVNPSVNLARPEGRPWNFQHLMRRTEAARSAAGGRLPVIRIRGGRINLKFGDTKSIFYVSDASLDATPPDSAGGQWRVRFEGEPARTDRPTRSFGRLTAQGRWRPSGEVDASIELEKSSLSDLIRLLHGYDVGVHGQISFRARLSGPASAIDITGRAELSDVHRWDLLPPHSGVWPLDVSGKLDLTSQTLELRSASSDGSPLPIALEFHATGYLRQPRWAALARFDRFPLAPLPEVARHMGLALSPQVALSGVLSGAIGYSLQSGIQGAVLLDDASVTLPESPPLRLARAEVRLTGDTARLAPAVFTAQGSSATVEASYNRRTAALAAEITSSGMPLVEAAPGDARLFAPLPILGQCRRGTWRGRLEYRFSPPAAAAWTGAFQLEDAAIDVPGLASPVELLSARVTLRENGAAVDRINGRAGPIEFQGDYRYVPGAPYPDQFHLSVPKLQTEELERLLLPTLRRDESLLARAWRLGRTTVPAWLEARHADGAIEIGSLLIWDIPLKKLRAHVRWDGPTVDVGALTAQFAEGSLAASLTANLRRPAPSYRFAGRFQALGWSGGRWDGRGTLETSGTGPELVSNLRLLGAFKTRSFALADTELKSVSGACALSVPRGVPALECSELEMTLGEVALKGQGTTGPDGRLYLDLSSGAMQLRLAGTLWPLQLEFAAPLTSPAP
jgi:hypothetical protein